MLLEKQFTYRGHRWNEILQDFNLTRESGVGYIILKRPVSRPAFERDSTFVTQISVKLTELLADPKVSDDVIRFCSSYITHRVRSQVFIATEDLQAICNVTINSELRRALDIQLNENCPYCVSAESGHSVHCRNFQKTFEVEKAQCIDCGKYFDSALDYLRIGPSGAKTIVCNRCANRINEDYNESENCSVCGDPINGRHQFCEAIISI